VLERLRRLERLRELDACLVAPGTESGWRKAFFVSAGELRVVRTLPPGAGAMVEVETGLALCRSADPRSDEPLSPEQAEDMLLLDSFVRRPPSELAVLPLDRQRIAAHLSG